MIKQNNYPVYWPSQSNLDYSMANLNSTLISASGCVVAAWIVRSAHATGVAAYHLRRREEAADPWIVDPEVQRMYKCVAVALLAGDRAAFSAAWALNFGRACCVQAMSRSEVSAAIAAALPDLRMQPTFEGDRLVYETVKLTAYSEPKPHADFTL